MAPGRRPGLYGFISRTDFVAESVVDPLLLIGSVLRYSYPGFMSSLAIAVEWVIGITLTLGFAVRYAALLGLIYVIVATVTAHRYWQYPQAQQLVQYIFATKNLSILGGLLILFVSGGGRYSIDHQLKRTT